jgi:hypothetical protein
MSKPKETEVEKMQKDLGKALGGMKVVQQPEAPQGKTEFAKDQKEYKDSIIIDKQ